MACYYPLHGFRGVDGTVKFSRKDAFEDLPVSVSCGQCRGCRLERARTWAVRCLHEAQLRDHNCFLTLTYNNKNLPSGGTLVLDHWKNFAKKWRRDRGKFRYFHCGEYGDENGRPHYHALIFGDDFHEDRKLWSNKNGFPLYTSKKLEALWPHGYSKIGSITFESAGYVARYAMKKFNGPTSDAFYERVDEKTGEVTQLKPEYCTMSRNPGLGQGWINRFHSDVYPSDEVIVNGKRTRPPAYYDTMLERNDPKLMKTLKSIRKAQGAKHKEDQTDERLHEKEQVLIARTRTLKREL